MNDCVKAYMFNKIYVYDEDRVKATKINLIFLAS